MSYFAMVYIVLVLIEHKIKYSSSKFCVLSLAYEAIVRFVKG